MSASHSSLDALRRLAKERTVNPAEKARAGSAKASAAENGTRPRRRIVSLIGLCS
jgi:hypothetical protein